MTDESTAEKAYEAAVARKDTGSPREAFMAGRASRDAEVAELRSKRERSDRWRKHNDKSAAEVIESLREQLAATQATMDDVIRGGVDIGQKLTEAQATIEKALIMTDDMRSVGWHIGKTVPELGEKLYAILSAPSSTGGETNAE